MTKKITSQELSDAINDELDKIDGKQDAFETLLASVIIADDDGGYYSSTPLNSVLQDIGVDINTLESATPVVTKDDVGLGNVTNDAQLPLAGGTMTGILYPQNNTSYTTGQARRIILSTGVAEGGGNGDIWLKYTE